MKKTLLASAFMLASVAMYAQTEVVVVEECCTAPVAVVPEGDQGVRFIDTDKNSQVYDIMQANAPNDALLKDAPRFALVGKNSKFYLGIGANVMLVGDFDWGHPISNANKFTTSDIPMSIEKGDGGQFQFSAAQSDFYLNFVGLPGSDNQIGVFLDVNFMNGSHNPALHHAYVKYRGITAGHTLSIFTDNGARAASIDYEGPNAYTFMGHPNISYTGKFGKDRLWSAAIGLDMPEFTGTFSENLNRTVSQRVPDIPVYLQRGWCGGKGYLRASAIFRTLTYRDLKADKNENVLGWGVKLSGRTPICGGLSAMWEGVYGQGIASYIQDLTNKGMDLVPDKENNGKMEGVKAWAAYGTLQYVVCPRVMLNATYSQVRTYANDWNNTSWNQLYKWAQYVTANCFVRVNSFTQVGAEYLYGRRKDFGGMQAHDNRISLMLKVSL